MRSSLTAGFVENRAPSAGGTARGRDAGGEARARGGGWRRARRVRGNAVHVRAGGTALGRNGDRCADPPPARAVARRGPLPRRELVAPSPWRRLRRGAGGLWGTPGTGPGPDGQPPGAPPRL